MAITALSTRGRQRSPEKPPLTLASPVSSEGESNQMQNAVTCDALGTRLLVSVAFVGRRVQEHDGEDVQVPHSVDAGEEGAVHLHHVVPQVPMALIHLQLEPRRRGS